MTDKKLTAISAPEVDPLQADLVAKIQSLLREARAGRLIALVGVEVREDEDGEQSVHELDEGYALGLADLILMLQYKVQDLTEDWQAQAVHGFDPDADD